MEKRTNFYDFIDKIQRQDRYIEELEEENKKLKEEIENHKQNIMQDELEIIPKLEEENRKLKSDLSFERTMLDNVRAEYESLQNIIKKMKEEIKWWKDLVHKAKKFEYDEDGMDYIWQNTENL